LKETLQKDIQGMLIVLKEMNQIGERNDDFEFDSKALDLQLTNASSEEVSILMLLEFLVDLKKIQTPFHLLPPSNLLITLSPWIVLGASSLAVGRLFSLNMSLMSGWWAAAKDVVIAFASDWVISPILGVLNTVRFKERRLSLLGSSTLQSDFEVFLI
jgi:hypothetical protein